MSKTVTIDLFAFSNSLGSGMRLLNPELLKNGGAACTGVQKLVQSWLLLFLTPKGSLQFNPDRGSSFLKHTTSMTTESQVHSAFVFANADVIQQLRQSETLSQPDSERIDKVTLEKYFLHNGSLTLQVRIQSKAGDSRTVELPVNANPIII